MFVYIQKDTKSIYVEFEVSLDEELYDTGATWEDYIRGAWVQLSEAQLAFRASHPEASVPEVFAMQIHAVAEPEAPERTLADARWEKLQAIEEYDGTEVNQFFIQMGEVKIPCWFDATQRATYQTSITARRKLIEAGLETDAVIQLPVAGHIAVLPLDGAELMLARLQKYADDAFNVTYMHRAAVEALTEIADVDGYDYTAGYPERLTFTL
jgi:hypothetical protein